MMHLQIKRLKRKHFEMTDTCQSRRRPLNHAEQKKDVFLEPDIFLLS